MRYAPVAQWIEHRPPEPGAEVRSLSGVPWIKSALSGRLKVLFFILTEVLTEVFIYQLLSGMPGSSIF